MLLSALMARGLDLMIRWMNPFPLWTGLLITILTRIVCVTYYGERMMDIILIWIITFPWMAFRFKCLCQWDQSVLTVTVQTQWTPLSDTCLQTEESTHSTGRGIHKQILKVHLVDNAIRADVFRTLDYDAMTQPIALKLTNCPAQTDSTVAQPVLKDRLFPVHTSCSTRVPGVGPTFFLTLLDFTPHTPRLKQKTRVNPWPAPHCSVPVPYRSTRPARVPSSTFNLYLHYRPNWRSVGITSNENVLSLAKK